MMTLQDWDEDDMFESDVYAGVFTEDWDGEPFVEVEAIAMTRGEELTWLMAEARRLPPMTNAQKAEQRLSWTYGNLAIDCPVSREAFKTLALSESIGWTAEQFDVWSNGKKWDLP